MAFVQNKITVAGKLVEKNLEIKVIAKDNQEPYEAIGGSLKIRTNDGSEHTIDVFSKRLTNSGAESKVFQGLETCMEQYRGIGDLIKEGLSEEEAIAQADIIQTTSAKFSSGKPYKNKEGKAVISTKVNSQFFGRIEGSKIEATPLVATFSITGKIVAMSDVMKDNAPTGDKWLDFDVVEKFTNTQKNEDSYSLHSVRCFLEAQKVNMFMGAGFQIGQPCNLAGDMVNIETKVEKRIARDFGDDEIKIFTNYDRRNVIKGGSIARSQDDICFTEQVYQELVAKRNMEKSAIENGAIGGQTTGANPFVQNSTPNNNPFMAPATNPFA